MALLLRGEELLGPVRIARRNAALAGGGLGHVTLEAEFLVLPGSFLLVDEDGTRRPITITTVFPSMRPLRAEAQLEPV